MADFARTDARSIVVDFTLPIYNMTYLTFLFKKFNNSDSLKTLKDLAKLDTMRYGFIGGSAVVTFFEHQRDPAIKKIWESRKVSSAKLSICGV